MNQPHQLIRRSYQIDWRQLALYRTDQYAPQVGEYGVTYGMTTACLFNLSALWARLNPFKSHGNR